MHGLGNDIVIIDLTEQLIKLSPAIISQLADRHTGIGFDQLITIENNTQQANFFCRIYNADGTEAEQCGNGMRCVARYLHEQKRHSTDQLTIETIAGVCNIVINNYVDIAVSMNSPTILNQHLMLSTPLHGAFDVCSLSVGNPHIIIQIDNVADFPISVVGAQLSTDKHFTEGTNVGFMQIINQHEITLRTYERGAGLTLACGSNACAAAVTGITQGILTSPVTVNFERGPLTIEWDQQNKLIMRGAAENCFNGEWIAAISDNDLKMRI